MDNQRKEIKQTNTRKSQHQKLKDALAKKPTASYLQSIGVSQNQINEQERQRLLKERLVKNGKNRKRFSNRPTNIQVSDENQFSFMTVTSNSEGTTIEQTVPRWFKTTEKVDVSVIVPLYKSNSVILDLIKHWPLKNDLKVEIIFVDDSCPNNSKDVVIKAWNKRRNEITDPIGKIFYNTKNKGYGGACNAGAAMASGDYLVFLNADTQVTPGWLEPMIELFQDPTVGLVGNMHLKQGGGLDKTIDSAGSEWKWDAMSFVHIGRHCYNKQGINTPYRIENAPKELLEVSEREMVTGCCFAMKKQLFDYIGGFNANYRIGYWEDSEICLNVRELGYKILFQPKSIIYHKLGHTSSGGHRYFRHNRDYFINKWVQSHRLDSLLLSEARPDDVNPVQNILIKRTNAHGDALIASAVCAALKKRYPTAKIAFSTLFPEVIKGNPYIDKFVDTKYLQGTPFDLFYNLDLCYEWRPKVNIMTAYAEYVGVKTQDCKIIMAKDPIDLPENFIVIHPGKTDWAGRDWPHDNFIEIANKLIAAGETVVCVGKYTEPEIPCTLDLRSQTTIAQMAYVMSKAKMFIGIDSFPMHVAQAFDVPGVSFFGSVLPELRIYSNKMKGINDNDLSCIGCHHRKNIPSTVTRNCENGTFACINNVTVEKMWIKILDILDEVNHGRISLLG